MKHKRHSLRKLLWYFILALPLLSYAILCINGTPTLSNVVAQFNNSLVSNNTVYSVMKDIFSANDFLLCGITDGMLQYFAYFVTIEFIHIVLDVILLLPQICHSFLEKCFGGENDD